MKVETGTWTDLAACRGRIDLFFPRSFRDTYERSKADRAIAICNTCPVIDRCRFYALHAHERFGIWGALTPDGLRDERRRLRIT